MVLRLAWRRHFSWGFDLTSACWIDGLWRLHVDLKAGQSLSKAPSLADISRIVQGIIRAVGSHHDSGIMHRRVRLAWTEDGMQGSKNSSFRKNSHYQAFLPSKL